MIWFVHYDPDTGRINGCMNANTIDEVALNATMFGYVVAFVDDFIRTAWDYWVIDGVVQKRPLAALVNGEEVETGQRRRIASDGIDTLVLSRLPIGSMIKIDGVASLITEDDLEISSTVPAVYHIEILEFGPCKQWEITVEVVA